MEFLRVNGCYLHNLFLPTSTSMSEMLNLETTHLIEEEGVRVCDFYIPLTPMQIYYKTESTTLYVDSWYRPVDKVKMDIVQVNDMSVEIPHCDDLISFNHASGSLPSLTLPWRRSRKVSEINSIQTTILSLHHIIQVAEENK